MAQPPEGVDEQSTRHTSTPKGRFVLRADSIRPYGSSGEAATIHPAAQLRKRSGGFYPPLRVAAAEPPTGRLVVDPYRAYAFNRVLAKNRGFRADAIRPNNKCIY